MPPLPSGRTIWKPPNRWPPEKRNGRSAGRPGPVAIDRVTSSDDHIAAKSFARVVVSSLSASLIRLATSLFEQQSSRIFDQLFDADEELDRFRAVDDAVVVGQRHVHHRADLDLAVDGDGTVLDGVQPEDADLRRIEDRRAEERPEDTAVGDRESA